MKKYIKILIPCMILVLLLAGVGIAFLLSNSDPDDQGSILEDTPYSYQNPETAHAEYETDLFTIDGTLDEDIYSSLCWWEETYQEGEFQAPVNVKTTCYLGENGVYFIFDVDDDKVYVNPARISFANSCISLYVAEEGTTALNDNVWEIDIQPNNDINAKRYTGDLGFATILANGYENKPVIATATKGGAINTDDCKGYVMETYFPYEYLFGEGCEKPEKLKLNFALIRNFSADTSKSRDLYYNFGQNVITGWSWGNPDTWWTFEKYGLESVGLQLEAGEGGTFVDASNRLEKFLSHRIGIVPEEGYRIVSVTKTVGGETVDVTDQLTWEDGVSYLKLYLVTEDIALKATFEPIPQERYSLSGKITYKGKALSETELADIGVRYIDGGVGYTGELAGDGSYVLNVPAGQGRLEVCSKAGYVAKRQNVKIEAKDLQVNVDLTSNDYGNTRIISLPDEMVMRNGEVLFDGSNMLDTLNNTFAYDFTLTYDGKLLNDDGSIIKDPTFGKYANNFTVINIRGTFADQEGKDIANSNFLFQILHWDNDWRAKLYIDNQAIEQNISHKALLESFGEDGVRMRLLFADSKMGLYVLNGSKCYKVYEKELAATADRYLKTLTFYSENCVNNSVWAIKDQQIALGRTPGNYSVTSLISIYKSKVTTAKYNVFEDFENLQIPGSWFNKYNISYQDVIDENGNVLKDATVTMRVKMQGSTFYNGLITIALKSSGVSKLTGGLGADPWTFFGGVILNADQLKQMGSEDGLDIFSVHSDGGKTMTVYVQDGDKLVPCWTVTDPSKELKLKGYEIQFDTAGGQVTAESVTHKGGFLDAVSQLYGDEYTVTDVITVHKSETTVKDTNTFVDYVDRLSVGNWFYRYDIRLPEAVDENGDITQAATAIMRTKMHGSMDYNSLIKLTLNPSGINTLEIGRGADPWDSQIVVLSDEQVKQLGTESGLSIFVVHTGDILAVSQSTATVKNVNTFVDYGDNTVGGNWFNRYSIRIDNAVDADGNVTQAAEALLRVKLAGSGGIYNAMLRLTLNTSGNSYLTGTNRNGPSDYNFYNVNLTGKQLKQLGTEEGLVL